ncbi:MAG: DegT/DnrJ/EryC1/StrS family aminotransferase [Candidatus Aminicenantes bacterium]|nr:DegT/DnrJ/EryC1/StrS family aminotransferase [Candidatus Aminicenantes bacterium]
MNIPILDLKAQYASIREEINRKVLDVLASQNFILGAEVRALEEEAASYSGARFAVGVSSGSDALLISLMALGIGGGDAVVTTPFTFFATAGAIARVGAEPVFCDIDERTFNIDPESLREVIEGRMSGRQKAGRKSRGNGGRGGREGREGKGTWKATGELKAIIPVHLYGQCADMDPILAVAREYGLAVIEDAAQAIGSEYPSRRRGVKKAGTMGTLGTLSFYPSKNLGGCGDGGMVLTDSPKLADKLRCLRQHGDTKKYYYKMLGGNFRLDALQAAILRVKLGHLDAWQAMRRERAEAYGRKFAECGLIEAGIVKLPVAVYKESGITNYHTYHQYVIRAKNRDALQTYLKEKGVGTSVFYPLPLHLQKCFAYLGYKRGDFPVSERAAKEVLALPMYPELTAAQQDYIVSSLLEFGGHYT